MCRCIPLLFLVVGLRFLANAEAPSDTSPNCACTNSKIWLDVVFVVDVSNDMTASGLDNAVALIKSPLYSLTLGSERFQTRVAIVGYSTDSSIIRAFDTILSYDDIDNIDIPYLGGNGTNVKSGLSLASMLLSKLVTDRNARKVIVLIASAFRSGDLNDPDQLASQFKNSGGNIMTVSLCLSATCLTISEDLASPGFSFTSDTFTSEDLLAMFCQANCFCPARLLVYSTNDQLSPDGGCYEYVNLAAVYRAANSSCHRKQDRLVTIHDADKQAALHKLVPPKTMFWIGLTRDAQTNSFIWNDGTDYTSSYQNWAPGQPSTVAGEDCVYSQQYSGFKTGWYAVRCMQSCEYLCESRPCDTEFYCL